MPAGEMIRVNAQLVDTVSHMHLRAERFDKPRADVLAMQDEIIGRLARSVGRHMARGASTQGRHPHDADAMDLVMRGFGVVHQRMTLSTAEEAMRLFRQALALDASHVEAHVGLASMLVYQVVNFYRDDRDAALDEAAISIDLALSVDPTHLQGLKTEGAYLRARGLFQDAIAVDRAIIEQNPGEPTAYREIGLTTSIWAISRRRSSGSRKPSAWRRSIRAGGPGCRASDGHSSRRARTMKRLLSCGLRSKADQACLKSTGCSLLPRHWLASLNLPAHSSRTTPGGSRA